MNLAASLSSSSAVRILILFWVGIAQPAEEDCTAFRWDVSHEVALFRTQPLALVAGDEPEAAPVIEPERLYDIALVPQSDLRFAAAPAKRMLTDGAHAGLLRLRVTRAGTYRIALDETFWVDVVQDGRGLPSRDFQGSPGCTPHKIVLFDLPAQATLILQLSGKPAKRARLSITKTPEG